MILLTRSMPNAEKALRPKLDPANLNAAKLDAAESKPDAVKAEAGE